MFNAMTVTVGKKSINLGWEIAASISLFLIYTTYKCVTFTDKLIASQAEIKQELAVWAKRDSVYIIKPDKNTLDIDSIKPGIALVKQQMGSIFSNSNNCIPNTHYYTLTRIVHRK